MEITPQLIEECCMIMHDAYEEAAIAAGWETQKASRTNWSGVPEANKITMRAAVKAVLTYLDKKENGDE